MDVRHEVEDALFVVPSTEKADTAATRQQAPPAASRGADGWDDEDGSKDEKAPPRLRMLVKGCIFCVDLVSETNLVPVEVPRHLAPR